MPVRMPICLSVINGSSAWPDVWTVIIRQAFPGVQTTHVDYGESYIRYHGESSRITAGAQTVIWGRTDEIPPNDRMSVQDLSRFILDELPQRRRAVPELRVEKYNGPFKADLLWMPAFRPAELPSFDNIWSPVDRNRGRIISIDSTPVLTQLVEQGKFTRDVGGQGGAGLRLSSSRDSLDYAMTVQRTRHSAPYYELDPTVRPSCWAAPVSPRRSPPPAVPSRRSIRGAGLSVPTLPLRRCRQPGVSRRHISVTCR